MLAIDADNLIEKGGDKYQRTPLHHACETGSAATVMTLLFVASDDDEELREYVSEYNSFRRSALLDIWWMLGENYHTAGITLSEVLHKLENINSPNDLEGFLNDTWDKTVLILKACTGGFSSGGQWNVVHAIAHAAALNIEVPRTALWVALKLFPEQARWKDGDGNLPLHVISSASVGTLVDIQVSDEDELDDQAKLIYKQIRENPQRMVLNLCPDAASIPNNSGRLPLHMALHHGLSGETAAMFLKAAPESVNSRDPVTMLFPFMLAACDVEDEDVDENKGETMLDATYILLRENPANVQGGIPLTEKNLSRKPPEEKREHAEETARAKDLVDTIAELESQSKKRKHRAELESQSKKRNESP